MPDDPAAISKLERLARQIALWTAVLLAVGGLIDALNIIVNRSKSFTCIFEISFSWCQSSTITQTNINPPRANINNRYSVFVIYPNTRVEDSRAVATGLTAAGFQTHEQSVLFLQMKLRPHGEGSSFIVLTDKGKKIGDVVLQIVRQSLRAPAMMR